MTIILFGSQLWLRDAHVSQWVPFFCRCDVVALSRRLDRSTMLSVLASRRAVVGQQAVPRCTDCSRSVRCIAGSWPKASTDLRGTPVLAMTTAICKA